MLMQKHHNAKAEEVADDAEASENVVAPIVSLAVGSQVCCLFCLLMDTQ